MSADGWGRSLRGGVVWSTLTFVAAKALTFLSMLVLARLLVPREFGAVAAVATFLAFIELGSDLGMKATVVYEQEEGFSDRLDTAFTLNVALVVAFTVGGVALAPAVAGFFHLENHVGLFRLGVLSLLLTGLGNVHDGVLLRELEFRRRAVPELVRGLTRGTVAIVLAALGLGALSIVLGMLAGSAAWTLAQWRLVPYRPHLRLDRATARTMVAYGIGASLLQVVSAVSQNTDTAAVGRVAGATALGLYTVGFRIPELVIANVGQEVSIVAFPALARKRAEGRKGLTSATLQLLRYQALYAVSVGVGVAVLAPPLIVVLFSDRWRAAGGVMSAIAIMCAIGTTIYPLGDVFKALAKQRILVALNVIQLPLLVAGVILAAPAGILAVAWTRVAGMALFAALFVACVKRVLGLTVGELARALWPALATAAGIGAGAGAVRIAWPALSIAPLAVAALAAAASGGLALRYSAPDVLAELGGRIGRFLPFRRAYAGADV